MKKGETINDAAFQTFSERKMARFPQLLSISMKNDSTEWNLSRTIKLVCLDRIQMAEREERNH